MLKIWAKAIKEEKIVLDLLYKRDIRYDGKKFLDYLVEICYELDIPTPIVLKSHIHNFENFNITKFRSSDFVESVSFETLILENASE